MSDQIPDNRPPLAKPGLADLVRNEAGRASKEAMDYREARRVAIPPKAPLKVESTFAASPNTSTNQFETPKGKRRGPLAPDSVLEKPFAFALGSGKDGATIFFGQLLSTVSIIRFKRFKVAGEWVNSLIAQDPIKGVITTVPGNLDTGDAKMLPTELSWFGDVYLYWEANSSTGKIDKCEIRGPGTPEGSDIKELDETLSRGSGSGSDGEGKYYVKIGTVDEKDGVTDQAISSDVTWAVTLIPEGNTSSDSSSSSGSSEGSSGPSDSSTPGSSVGPSGSPGSSESEKSSNAIVEGPWTEGKFVALATMESNQVLFEFVVRDIPLRGPVTKVMIDPRFLYVCEPDSLCVAAAPCGDAPYAVGASVKGEILTLTGLSRKDRRPSRVNVRLTGVRKGFKDWDMPSRNAKQKQQSEEARLREYDR